MAANRLAVSCLLTLLWTLGTQVATTKGETIRSPPEDVSPLLQEVLLQHLPACQIVLVSDEKDVYYQQLVNSISSGLSVKDISGLLTFSVDSVLALKVPPPSLLTSRLDQLCISYVVLASLPRAAIVNQYLFKSDWFLGATRYTLWFGGSSITKQDIANQDGLMETVNIAYVSPEEIGDGYTIFGSCPYCPNGKPEVKVRERWSKARGFFYQREIFPFSLQNFNGHHFRAVSMKFTPFVDYIFNGDGNAVTRKDALDIRIMDTIAEKLNFTYDIYEPVDGKWGYQYPNKSWTGVIGTIERYEADFSMDMSITGDRELYVDFTIGYHLEPLTFALSKPAPLPQWLSLIRPFQLTVWFTLLSSVLVAAFICWLLLRGAWFAQTKGTFDTEVKKPSLLAAGDMVYRAFLRQDTTLPKKSSGQVFMGIWLLFSLVVTISYVSNLTAFMTIPAFSSTINSLDELSRSDYGWGVTSYGAADYQLLKTSTVPLYQNIFKKLELCPDKVSCLQRTLDERFAYISYITFIRDAVVTYFTDRNGEVPIYLARDTFFPGELGFTLQKNSPLKKPFDGVLRMMLEGGFIPKWLTEFIEAHKQEGQQMSLRRDLEAVGGDVSLLSRQDDKGTILTLYHLQGVFAIFGSGLALSVVVFVVEFVLDWKQKGNRIQ